MYTIAVCHIVNRSNADLVILNVRKLRADMPYHADCLVSRKDGTGKLLIQVTIPSLSCIIQELIHNTIGNGISILQALACRGHTVSMCLMTLSLAKHVRSDAWALIPRRFSLEQASEAFRVLLARKVIGKVLLVPAGAESAASCVAPAAKL